MSQIQERYPKYEDDVIKVDNPSLGRRLYHSIHTGGTDTALPTPNTTTSGDGITSNQGKGQGEAGTLYGFLRAGVQRVVVALGVLFRNPLGFFRPTHTRLSVFGVLHQGFPQAANPREALRFALREAYGSPKSIIPVLWNAAPALVLNTVIGVTMFSTFDHVQSGGHPAWIAGAVSGAAITPLTIPLEAFKFKLTSYKQRSATMRMENTESKPFTFFDKSLRQRISAIPKNAIAAIALRETIGLAAFFGVYTGVRENLLSESDNLTPWPDTDTDTDTDSKDKPSANIGATVMAATAGGVTATLLTTPFDSAIEAISKGQQFRPSSAMFYVRLQSMVSHVLPPVVGLVVYEYAKYTEEHLEDGSW
eukprot:m.10592 g.10592  ORF g.10592 m.10592 type:complete len:364 (+) comp4288_c0_seq2:298-1389(+)